MMNFKYAVTIGAMTAAMTLSAFAAGNAENAGAAGSRQDIRETALAVAGVGEEDVVFTGQKEDPEGGLFEVSFFVPGQVKYVVDIDAGTGSILDEKTEAWSMEDDFEYASFMLNDRGAGTAAVTGITEDQAREISLMDADLCCDDVDFFNCSKDFEDGLTKFELKFSCDGKEYQYMLNADNGTILEKVVESDC